MNIFPKTREEWLKLRTEDVTSTEISTLFGQNPYKALPELFVQKLNADLGTFEPSEQMQWGLLLQDTIARAVAERQGWKVRRATQYARLEGARMGASLDFEIIGTPGKSAGNLEVKCVDRSVFDAQWIVDGDYIEAPAHIELQLQAQMACTDRSWAALVALVGGNRAVVALRDRDDEVIALMRVKVEEFWTAVKARQMPQIDWQRDAEAVRAMYRRVTAGKRFESDDESLIQICSAYREACADEKDAKARKEVASAQILQAIDDAERARIGQYNISAGEIAATPIAYTRAAYRNFKLTERKAK